MNNPVTRVSSRIRDPCSNGSSSAICLICSNSVSLSRDALLTRSRTIRSSPSAFVYWKFVIESTRLE